jgi:hypothetical protein
MTDHEAHWEKHAERLLKELSAEFELELRREAEQAAAAATRAQAGQVSLWERLSRLTGGAVTVQSGPMRVHGTLLASYPDLFTVRSADGWHHLVHPGPSVSVVLAPGTCPLRPAASVNGYGFALAMRELARRREPVRILLSGSGMAAGTIETVGDDYLELAEHDPAEARRRAALTGHRLLPFEAVAVVSLAPSPPAPR